MEKQRILSGKPSKLFVYLPVYLKDKLKRIVIQDRMQLATRIEVGDSFAISKRDNPRDLLGNNDELKVEQVKWTFTDGSCIVVLGKMVFKTEVEMVEFLKGTRSIDCDIKKKV